MPSGSHRHFENNIIDVQRLLANHSALKPGTPGRHGLGHLTRGGVLLLCGAWELYTESVVQEALAFLTDRCTAPQSLPKEVQKALASHVKGAKHELKPLELSGDGWRKVLLAHAAEECAAVNTPKPAVLDGLFERLLGLSGLSTVWSCGPDVITDFVTRRGEIAHRGRAATYVQAPALAQYLKTVRVTATETDEAVADHVKQVCGKRPWRGPRRRR